MSQIPETLDEFCNAISEYAAQLGINKKNMALLLPCMSTHQIAKVMNDGTCHAKYLPDLMYAHDILVEIASRGVMPISPKTAVPGVISLVVDAVVYETRYAISIEQFGLPDTDGCDDLKTYEFMSAKAHAALNANKEATATDDTASAETPTE